MSNHNVIFELSMFDLVYVPVISLKTQKLSFCAVALYVALVPCAIVECPSSDPDVIFELSMFDLVYVPVFSLRTQNLHVCAVAHNVAHGSMCNRRVPVE